MKQKVSVIVPVYNVENYLKRCLDSLINQTYHNLQIILVDDGSKDNSLSICKKYATNDKRIEVYHKKNEGLGLTRNYGLKYVTGDYITFVDSDDFLVLDAVEKMLEIAIKYNVDLVIANSYYKDIPSIVGVEEGIYYDSEIKSYLMLHVMGNSPSKMDALSYTAWGKLYKKELLDNNHFPSEKELIWEDLAFNSMVYPKCNGIYVSHYPVYNYCFNESSLTHIYRPNKLELILKMYQYMECRISDLKLSKDAKIRLDNNFLGHIRTCLKLEVFYSKINGKRTALKNVKHICNNTDVQKLIRSYPEQNYNKIQYIYNFFLKKKLSYIVYFLTWLQNSKKRIE